MTGLPAKPEFLARYERPPQDDRDRDRDRERDRHPARRERGGDSYAPPRRGGPPPRAGPSSYRRERSRSPPRHSTNSANHYAPPQHHAPPAHFDSYRPGQDTYAPRGQRREYPPRGRERDEQAIRDAHAHAERLAREGKRNLQSGRRPWQTREERGRRDWGRERSRSPARRGSRGSRRSRSPRRRTSMLRARSPTRSARGRSPSRDESPEEGAVTPEGRARRGRSPSDRSRSRSRSRATSRSRSRSRSSRSRSPEVKKHRLPTSTLKPGTPPRLASILPVKPEPEDAITSTVADVKAELQREPLPAPQLPQKPQGQQPAIKTRSVSPAVSPLDSRDKGKMREEHRDAEGDVKMEDAAPPAPAPLSTPALPPAPSPIMPPASMPAPVSAPAPALSPLLPPKSAHSPALPPAPASARILSPTTPALSPVPGRFASPGPGRFASPAPPSAPVPAPVHALPARPGLLPAAQAQAGFASAKQAQQQARRAASPDPVAIRRRLEARGMSKEEKDKAERAAEGEKRAWAAHHASMTQYHLRNPSTLSFDLRRRLRQAAHEMAVTLLDSDAVGMRVRVAEEGVDRAVRGVLGEGVRWESPSPPRAASPVGGEGAGREAGLVSGE